MKDFNIQELIVVEGKNDAHVIRRALGKVDVIWTEGYGLTKDKLNYIYEVAKTRGVIICTDPDFAGEQIRRRLQERVPQAAHVYLSRAVAVKNGDIGVENVTPEEIRKAFAKVLRTQSLQNNCGKEALLTMLDLLDAGLAGHDNAAVKRSALGKVLGIGDTNAKQCLHRLNRLKINREEFLRALAYIEGNEA